MSMNMYGYMIKPRRKWWVMVFYTFYLLPRRLRVRVLKKNGLAANRDVRVNRLYLLRPGDRKVEWFDDEDSKVFAMARFIGRPDAVEINRERLRVFSRR